MPGYIISKEAVKDINDIWMYTAEKWSVEQADLPRAGKPEGNGYWSTNRSPAKPFKRMGPLITRIFTKVFFHPHPAIFRV